jgi:hypothetical protein
MGGTLLPGERHPARTRRGRSEVRRMLRALAELARSRRQLSHVPTLMQVRAMAHFDGSEPCSYLLDPAVNYVPELPLGPKIRWGGTRCASPAAIPTAVGDSSW